MTGIFIVGLGRFRNQKVETTHQVSGFDAIQSVFLWVRAWSFYNHAGRKWADHHIKLAHMPTNDPNASSASQRDALSTTSSLIGRLQEDSPERWHSFVMVYSPLIRFWIRQDRVKPDCVDDVLQETLKSVFRGIQQFQWKAGSGTFRGWLRTIVKRRAADHFRLLPRDQLAQQETLEQIETPEQVGPGSTEAEEKALLDLKARALERIRQSTAEKTWQMFWMSAVEDVPTSEIAQKFNVTPAAVRMAKSRVIIRLRQELLDL